MRVWAIKRLKDRTYWGYANNFTSSIHLAKLFSNKAEAENTLKYILKHKNNYIIVKVEIKGKDIATT